MSYAASSFPTFSAVRQQPVAERSLELRRRHVRQIIVLLSIVMIMALLFVWTRIQVIQVGYEVSRQRKEVSDLIEQKHILEAEVAELKSPARLEQIAREQFGMRSPQGDEIVFLER